MLRSHLRGESLTLTEHENRIRADRVNLRRRIPAEVAVARMQTVHGRGPPGHRSRPCRRTWAPRLRQCSPAPRTLGGIGQGDGPIPQAGDRAHVVLVQPDVRREGVKRVRQGDRAALEERAQVAAAVSFAENSAPADPGGLESEVYASVRVEASRV